MGKYDVDNLTDKVDVGSQPGTMWSLSSQKPGHGLVELRDTSMTKLWQSDGLLPHMINIQFARRTAVTHVSLYMDFKEDDSYTPSKIRVMAGTHYHDLVEVRTRELKEPSGWKHFVLDKRDDRSESDEDEAEGSSDSDSNDGHSSVSSDGHNHSVGAARRTTDGGQAASKPNGHRAYLPYGVSKQHPPIYAYLVQVCILSNHAAGKDTHIRGIHIYGPPTIASRKRAKRDARKQSEAKIATAQGERRTSAAAMAAADRLYNERHKSRRVQHARADLLRWANAAPTSGESHDANQPSAEEGVDVEMHEGDGEPDLLHIPPSRRLNLLSSLR